MSPTRNWGGRHRYPISSRTRSSRPQSTSRASAGPSNYHKHGLRRHLEPVRIQELWIYNRCWSCIWKSDPRDPFVGVRIFPGTPVSLRIQVGHIVPGVHLSIDNATIIRHECHTNKEKKLEAEMQVRLWGRGISPDWAKAAGGTLENIAKDMLKRFNDAVEDAIRAAGVADVLIVAYDESTLSDHAQDVMALIGGGAKKEMDADEGGHAPNIHPDRHRLSFTKNDTVGSGLPSEGSGRRSTAQRSKGPPGASRPHTPSVVDPFPAPEVPRARSSKSPSNYPVMPDRRTMWNHFRAICTVCGEEFSDGKSYRAHTVENKHLQKCTICSRFFETGSLLFDHYTKTGHSALQQDFKWVSLSEPKVHKQSFGMTNTFKRKRIGGDAENPSPEETWKRPKQEITSHLRHGKQKREVTVRNMDESMAITDDKMDSVPITQAVLAGTFTVQRNSPHTNPPPRKLKQEKDDDVVMDDPPESIDVKKKGKSKSVKVIGKGRGSAPSPEPTSRKRREKDKSEPGPKVTPPPSARSPSSSPSQRKHERKGKKKRRGLGLKTARQATPSPPPSPSARSSHSLSPSPPPRTSKKHDKDKSREKDDETTKKSNRTKKGARQEQRSVVPSSGSVGGYENDGANVLDPEERAKAAQLRLQELAIQKREIALEEEKLKIELIKSKMASERQVSLGATVNGSVNRRGSAAGTASSGGSRHNRDAGGRPGESLMSMGLRMIVCGACGSLGHNARNQNCPAKKLPLG